MLKNKKPFYSKLSKRTATFLMKVIFILIFLNVFFGIIPNGAEAVITAAVRTDFVGKIEPAEVGLAQSGTVRYEGDVVVERDLTIKQSVVVYLFANAGGEGWGASIAPPMIYIQAGQTRQNFTLYITAPPAESVSVKKEVTITGRWETYPGAMISGEVEPNSIIQTVKHFSQFTIIPTKDFVKIWPTQIAEFELTVLNQGNGAETLVINIDDYENLVAAGYNVELVGENTITVEERGQGSFKFKVRGPQNLYTWKSHQTPIPIHIETYYPESEEEEPVNRPWVCLYYEVGFYIPEPCIFSIIFVIVIIIILVWAKKKNRLIWKKRRKKTNDSN